MIPDEEKYEDSKYEYDLDLISEESYSDKFMELPLYEYVSIKRYWL